MQFAKKNSSFKHWAKHYEFKKNYKCNDHNNHKQLTIKLHAKGTKG